MSTSTQSEGTFASEMTESSSVESANVAADAPSHGTKKGEGMTSVHGRWSEGTSAGNERNS